jgi:hypothetical protein
MHANLTDQNIADMLDAAGYGIGYWADWATVDEAARTYTVMPHEDPNEDKEPGQIVVTFDQIAEAFNKLLNNEPELLIGSMVHRYFLYAYADRDSNGIDAGHIDAEAADVLVQVALWGEVVYG